MKNLTVLLADLSNENIVNSSTHAVLCINSFSRFASRNLNVCKLMLIQTRKSPATAEIARVVPINHALPKLDFLGYTLSLTVWV